MLMGSVRVVFFDAMILYVCRALFRYVVDVSRIRTPCVGRKSRPKAYERRRYSFAHDSQTDPSEFEERRRKRDVLKNVFRKARLPTLALCM